MAHSVRWRCAYVPPYVRSAGASVRCEVDLERRLLISKSHTLTHVMNLALHSVLGDGVLQKGSLVDESKEDSYNNSIAIV